MVKVRTTRPATVSREKMRGLGEKRRKNRKELRRKNAESERERSRKIRSFAQLQKHTKKNPKPKKNVRPFANSILTPA